jgi:hypothetical protein
VIVITNVKEQRTYFAPQHVAIVRGKGASQTMAEIVMTNGEIVEIEKEQMARIVKRIEEGI